jgi:cation diffusion facilitator CzcD-associated flavoprotein CzcO
MVLPDSKKPDIIISGAGISGLVMAILLEKLGFSYSIFERSDGVKPLGMYKINICPLYISKMPF